VKLLILHWGTRGGGPQLQEYVGRAVSEIPGVRLSLSYDGASETRDSLARLNVPQLVVGRTRQRGLMRWVVRLLSQPFDSARLVRFCKSH
jgi:hypothetical protein